MNPSLPRVQALARALLESERTGAGAEAVLGACERVLQRLAERISPLVGAGGFVLLLQRAIKRARGEHGWLGAVRLESEAPWRLPGAADAAREAAAVEVGGAAEAVLAELIGLIARFLGADLAIRLVRQSFPEIMGGADTGSGTEETTHE